MIITQQSTQSFSAVNRICIERENISRFQQLIVYSLVISFIAIMRIVFSKRSPK
jgi:hypothetical protein